MGGEQLGKRFLLNTVVPHHKPDGHSEGPQKKTKQDSVQQRNPPREDFEIEVKTCLKHSQQQWDDPVKEE